MNKIKTLRTFFASNTCTCGSPHYESVKASLDSATRSLAEAVKAKTTGEAAFTKLYDEVRQERDAYKEKAALLDKPEIHDFVKAVVIEAAHQRAKWGTEHDEGKTNADWFWLIGWLGSKAVHNPPADDGRTAEETQLHRIITVAAAACNWHAAKLGQTNMRPGIATPFGEERIVQCPTCKSVYSVCKPLDACPKCAAASNA